MLSFAGSENEEEVLKRVDTYIENAKSDVSSVVDSCFSTAHNIMVSIYALLGREFDEGAVFSDTSLKAVEFIGTFSRKTDSQKRKIVAFFNRQPFVNQFRVS